MEICIVRRFEYATANRPNENIEDKRIIYNNCKQHSVHSEIRKSVFVLHGLNIFNIMFM